MGLQRFGVGMAAHRSFGADDYHAAHLAGRSGPSRAGFDHTHHRDAGSLRNLVEGQSRGCVAGDYQHLGAVLFEILRRPDSVSGDGLGRLRTVGESGGVAEVEVVSLGCQRNQLLENSESAEAGIEYADAGSSSRGHLWKTSYMRVASLRDCSLRGGLPQSAWSK